MTGCDTEQFQGRLSRLITLKKDWIRASTCCSLAGLCQLLHFPVRVEERRRLLRFSFCFHPPTRRRGVSLCSRPQCLRFLAFFPLSLLARLSQWFCGHRLSQGNFQLHHLYQLTSASMAEPGQLASRSRRGTMSSLNGWHIRLLYSLCEDTVLRQLVCGFTPTRHGCAYITIATHLPKHTVQCLVPVRWHFV